MRGLHDYGGPVITLNSADRETGEKTGLISGELRGHLNPQCIIHIQDIVESECLEEPGFHIEATPADVSPIARTRFDIYLSKERFHELTHVYDSEAGGGCFISRCAFDRICIRYHEEGFVQTRIAQS